MTDSVEKALEGGLVLTFPKKVELARLTIQGTVEQFGKEKVTVACSFGKDSVVTVHLCLSLYPDIDIFTVMTPFKFKETKEYKERMKILWGRPIREFCNSVEEFGEGRWKTDPEGCCYDYKVRPTIEALKGFDAWITGLRRTEGWTRKDLSYVERDKNPVKVNPILDWSELDVWRYLAINGIPVNPLYGEGYRSLGCEPCSAISKDETEPERAGRWIGTDKWCGECGIHSRTVLR